MFKKWAFVLVPLLVLGCAGSPGRVLLTKPDKLQAVSTSDLCKSYYLRPTAKLKLELRDRNVFTPEEWSFIDQRKIYIGMREVALMCAWGYPGLFGWVTESVTDQGTHWQWVYRSCPVCKAQYVYVKDGKVTNWQNVKASRTDQGEN